MSGIIRLGDGEFGPVRGRKNEQPLRCERHRARGERRAYSAYSRSALRREARQTVAQQIAEASFAQTGGSQACSRRSPARTPR